MANTLTEIKIELVEKDGVYFMVLTPDAQPVYFASQQTLSAWFASLTDAKTPNRLCLTIHDGPVHGYEVKEMIIYPTEKPGKTVDWWMKIFQLSDWEVTWARFDIDEYAKSKIVNAMKAQEMRTFGLFWITLEHEQSGRTDRGESA